MRKQVTVSFPLRIVEVFEGFDTTFYFSEWVQMIVRRELDKERAKRNAAKIAKRIEEKAAEKTIKDFN